MGVSESLSVSVAGSVGVGREVRVAANGETLAMVGIVLVKAAFAFRFIQNQAVTKARPAMRLTIQNPITNRRSFAVEEGGMG